MTHRRLPAPSIVAVSVLLAFLALALPAYASTGTIDPVHKYAWSNVGGYVNFAPASSTVVVSDNALAGYAWSVNDGWINLSPSNGGVLNDGQGNLSGFAWDETEGWVDFSGVTIDSSGKFHGQATGANETITFDCANCDVETTWRPASGTSGTQNPVSSHGVAGQSATPTSSSPSLATRAVLGSVLNKLSSILASVPQQASSSASTSESVTSTETASVWTGLLQVIQSLLVSIAVRISSLVR